MRKILKRTLGRGSEDQKGFTLIELLVVVGIIVALAAVIVPLVVQFSSKGDEGAWATELAVVQAAVDTLMTEDTVYTVTASVGAAINLDVGEDLGSAGTHTLDEYIRDLPTECEYTWTGAGVVTQAVAVGDTCHVG